jgi:cell envelope opacity-associated protein A
MEKLKDLSNSSNALMVHAEKIVTIAPKQRPVVITSLSVSITAVENLVSNLAQSVPELECSKRPNLSQATAMLRTSTFAQEENVQPTSSIVQMLRPVKLDFSNVQISLVLRMFSNVF